MKNKIKFINVYKRKNFNISEINEFFKQHINNKKHNDFLKITLLKNEQIIEEKVVTIAKDSDSNIIAFIKVILIKKTSNKYLYLHNIYVKKKYRKINFTIKFYLFFLRNFIKQKSRRHSNANYLVMRLPIKKLKRFKGAGHFLFKQGFKLKILKSFPNFHIWFKKIPISYKL